MDMPAGVNPACNEAVILDHGMMTDIGTSTDRSIFADLDKLLKDATFINNHVSLGLEISRTHGL